MSALRVTELVEVFAGADPALLYRFAAEVLRSTAKDFETYYPDDDATWTGPDVAAWLRAEAFHVARAGRVDG